VVGVRDDAWVAVQGVLDWVFEESRVT
jgi:hypothetical protein